MTAIPESSIYTRIRVFWGTEMPVIYLYDHNNVLINAWYFTEEHNIEMRIGVERVLDCEVETEDNQTRQRIRGYRLHIELFTEDVANRDLMRFLRQIGNATSIIFVPHNKGMQNPDDNSFNFPMVLEGDFNPEYLSKAYIGHSIRLHFKSKKLLTDIPKDAHKLQVIPAVDKTEEGVTAPYKQYSETYPDEKMIYGGWETSDDDLKDLAFVETAPAGMEDPDGV